MPPSPIDLTNLANIKSWLSIQAVNTSDDASIQACITDASSYFLWFCGLGPQDGTVPTASPLVAPVAFNETYDGNGSIRMFTRNRPIVSVQSLVIGANTIPQSTAWGIAGWVIDGTRKSISLRGGGGGMTSFSSFPSLSGWGMFFWKDTQNVNIQYTAGFASTPPDIELACRKIVAVNYKRRQWIDQRSQAMAGGAGTVQFRDWELPPEVMSVLKFYKREAIV